MTIEHLPVGRVSLLAAGIGNLAIAGFQLRSGAGEGAGLLFFPLVAAASTGVVCIVFLSSASRNLDATVRKSGVWPWRRVATIDPQTGLGQRDGQSESAASGVGTARSDTLAKGG